MSDYVVRGLTAPADIRIAAVDLTKSCEEGRRRHKTEPASSIFFSQALTSVSLMAHTLRSAMQKDERISMQLTGEGLVHGIIAEINASGHVRGTIDNPRIVGPLEVLPPPMGEHAILSVMRSTPLALMSQGAVPMFSDNIVDDVAVYLRTSEQVQSHLAVRIDVASDGTIALARGIIAQAMPSTDMELFERAGALFQTRGRVESILHAARTPERAAAELATQIGVIWNEVDRKDLAFQCTCTREKVADMLLMFSQEELQEMREEDDGAEVTCQFCGTVYELDADELGVLMAHLGDVN